MAGQTPAKITLVVSVFNEEAILPQFWQALTKVLKNLPQEKEVLFINDGSTDGSREILKNLATDHQEIKTFHFSRNFGHEAAMLAGIDHAQGNVIICLDSDLQHPPDKIPEMIEEWENGCHVVRMVRTKREDQKFFQGLMTKMFYWFINQVSPVEFEPNASDFFLISQEVAAVLRKEYRERTRFMRGYLKIIGFSQSRLEFEAKSRMAGESKYSFYKLLILSMEAIVAFSRIPLHLGLLGGVVCAMLGIGVGIYSIVMKFIQPNVPAGYTTMVVLVSFLFAFLFFLIGILGVYLGYIFEETKRRPIYLLESCEYGGNEG